MSSAAERRMQLRDEIRQFYADPDAASGGSGAAAAARRAGSAGGTGGASAASPELDLDSEYFSVGRYTTELLRRESLRGLVEADTALLRRMRRLDSDLQELVYRNYAKFLSANATIREMQDNVQEMGTKLQALSANVDDMDAVSRDISGALQQHRSEVDRTITANRLLRKVQFLADLPALMRRLTARRDYTACVRYWAAGDRFLAQHEHLGSIAAIHRECRALARELYAAIEAAMCAFPLDDPDAMDVIRRFVDNLRALRATSLFADAPGAAAADDTFEEGVLKALMRSVAESFSSGVASVQRAVRASLAVPDYAATPVLQRGQFVEQVNVREALAQLKSACALLSANSEKVHSLLNQTQLLERVTLRVAAEVQPVLIGTLEPISTMLADYASAAFVAIAAESGTAAVENPDAVRALVEAAAAAVARQLRSVAATLKGLGATYLDTKLNSQSAAYAAMVDDAILLVLRACGDTLAARATMLPPPQPPSATVFMTDAQREHNALLAGCVTPLVFASLSAALEAAFSAQLLETEVMAPSAAVAEACERLRRAAKNLQHRGVVLLGQVQARAVNHAVLFTSDSAAGGATQQQQQQQMQAPSVPPVLLSLAGEWLSVARVLQALPPALPLTAPSRGASAKNSVARTEEGSGYRGAGGAAAAGTSRHHRHRLTLSHQRKENADLQSNVARIFAAGGALLTLPTRPRDGRPATAIGCVAVYVLKALVDTVRQVSAFSQPAFARLQVCATYLLRLLLASPRGTALREWAAVWEADGVAPAMHRLLEEACMSAYERYEAKVPLPDAAIDAVVTPAVTGAPAPADKGSHAAAAAVPEPDSTATAGDSASTPLATTNASASITSVTTATTTAASEMRSAGASRTEAPAGVSASAPAPTRTLVPDMSGRHAMGDEDELPL